MLRKIMALAAAVALAAGCAPQEQFKTATSSPPPVNTSTLTPVTPTEEVTTDEPVVQETTEPDMVFKFGETAVSESGLRVTIGKPSKYKPTSSAAGEEGYKNFLKFMVTVENRTGKTVDPYWHITGQSGDREASQVFDYANGQSIGGAPSSKLLNGRKVIFPVVFAVDKPNDVVLDVFIDFDSSVVFTSTGQ